MFDGDPLPSSPWGVKVRVAAVRRDRRQEEPPPAEDDLAQRELGILNAGTPIASRRRGDNGPVGAAVPALCAIDVRR